MKYFLLPLSGVDDDIADATEWYELQQKGLGEKFIEDWETTVEYIISNPNAYQRKLKQYRHAYFKKFPYLIVYELERTNIIIYGVVNTKTHPKKWRLKTKRKQ